MARLHQLMDGVTTVSLINITGTIPMRGGLGSGRASPDFDLPGDHIRVAESYQLNLVGTSHDNAATQLQTLIRLLIKARQYHTEHWQTTPVYLKSQTTSETNARYALVYGCPELSTPDFFNHPFEVDSFIENFGLTIVRGVWRSAVPGTLPAALTLTDTDGPASQSLVHLANFRDDTTLTHIWMYDDSAAAYSANQFDQTGITYWSRLGAVPAVDDIVYIGSTIGPWHHFVTNIVTAGAYTADIQIEYYDGAAWVELVAGSEVTLYPTGDEDDLFKSTGDWAINVSPPDDWDTLDVNGATCWWIRLYITAWTAWVTTPVSHGTYTPYFQKTPFIEFPNTILLGDIPPIALLRLFASHGATTTPCMGTNSRTILGSKSRNLTKFDAFINLGNADNDVSWATTYNADTAAVADPIAPAGFHAACDFSNSTLMVTRITLMGTALLDDYIGLYRVFIRLQQVGGDDGDLEIRLRTSVGSVSDEFPKIDTEVVELKTHDAGWEIIDLGVLQLPFGELTAADTSTTDLIFQVMAARMSGAATIEFADLILMPIDEWSVVLDDPLSNVDLGSSALRGDSVLDVDAGVLMNRTVKYYRSGATLYLAETWYRSGEPPRLFPKRQTRIYFLMMHYPVDWGVGPFLGTLGMHLSAELRAQMLYLALRGSE